MVGVSLTHECYVHGRGRSPSLEDSHCVLLALGFCVTKMFCIVYGQVYIKFARTETNTNSEKSTSRPRCPWAPNPTMLESAKSRRAHRVSALHHDRLA